MQFLWKPSAVLSILRAIQVETRPSAWSAHNERLKGRSICQSEHFQLLQSFLGVWYLESFPKNVDICCLGHNVVYACKQIPKFGTNVLPEDGGVVYLQADAALKHKIPTSTIHHRDKPNSVQDIGRCLQTWRNGFRCSTKKLKKKKNCLLLNDDFSTARIRYHSFGRWSWMLHCKIFRLF
jgi:hypothetical protein